MEAEKLNKAFDCLHQEVSEAWLDTNSILFRHALEYQNKLSNFLIESKEAIEALHDCFWTVIKVMEDAGEPVSNGLGIAVHLVDMLPTIPIHLASDSSPPGLTGFMPEVYAAWPWFKTDVLDLMHIRHHHKVIRRCWMYCVKRLLKTWVMHQRRQRWLNQQCAFPWHQCLPLVERQAKSAPVMAPPRILVCPTHRVLWASVAEPTHGLGLCLHSVIHKVQDPVHPPLAPALGLGVHQEQAVQDPHDQDPALGLVPAPKCDQKVAVLMHQVALALHPLISYCCKVMMMILPQLEKRMQVT